LLRALHLDPRLRSATSSQQQRSSVHDPDSPLTGGPTTDKEQRRLDGVGIPPVRLRLGLGVQVEQVLAEVLGIGREVCAIRTGFAFGHLGLLL